MSSIKTIIIRRALISVSDKSDIVDFAKALHQFGVEIVSTGGTATLLSESGIPVVEVSRYTGFPEMMEGRLKTLHPKIHGGLLGRRGLDDEEMVEQNIPAIDMVVVNLYPFEATIARPGCDLETAIENIDIGGPAMLRAGAKNHAAVVVVTDKADYSRLIEEMAANGGAISLNTRYALAVKAFEHTAHYDGAIANYLGTIRVDGNRTHFPNTLTLQYHKAGDMRYGENPHQKAAFFVEADPGEPSVATARQLQGKELSYNNVMDTDAALECVKSFADPACVIVKHGNPCGVAVDGDILGAYRRAFETDPNSAFGGIIAFNRELDSATAKVIVDSQFVEVIIAPGIVQDALSVLAARQNVRVLSCGGWIRERIPSFDYRRVVGGLLVQDRDLEEISAAGVQVVSRRPPSEAELQDLLFAWRVVKFVKSNAIVYCRDGRTLGIGAGQMSRVYSAKIAALKAADEGLSLARSVMASDAFFPFRDGIDTAAEAGIRAVIQPGGSLRDKEVIAAVDEHGMAMVFTGMRHFRH